MSDEKSAASLAAVYIKIRNAIEQKNAAYKQEVGELEAQLATVSASLLEICSEQDANTIRTTAGTVSRRVSSRYWTSDWESMYAFIKEHDAPFLLEQRIHNSNMREFLEANPDALPAGLNSERKYVISVRKPT